MIICERERKSKNKTTARNTCKWPAMVGTSSRTDGSMKFFSASRREHDATLERIYEYLKTAINNVMKNFEEGAENTRINSHGIRYSIKCY